jgi:serine/threonine protein phosphatase PrpC
VGYDSDHEDEDDQDDEDDEDEAGGLLTPLALLPPAASFGGVCRCSNPRLAPLPSSSSAEYDGGAGGGAAAPDATNAPFFSPFPSTGCSPTAALAAAANAAAAAALAAAAATAATAGPNAAAAANDDDGDDARVTNAVVAALRASFLRTDAELAGTEVGEVVGSTAVVAVVGAQEGRAQGGDDGVGDARIVAVIVVDGGSGVGAGGGGSGGVVGRAAVVVAHAGDSRAVLVASDGSAEPLTRDHRPDRPDEAARVAASGGRVLFKGGSHRVMGVLAMTRAIGDHFLRPHVIAEPEVVARPRRRGDELLVLATDGLWDSMTNEEAAGLALRAVRKAVAKGVPRASACRIGASVLTRAAIDRGSRDNITVLVVDLAGGGGGGVGGGGGGGGGAGGAAPVPPPPPPAPPPPAAATDAAPSALPQAAAAAAADEGVAPRPIASHPLVGGRQTQEDNPSCDGSGGGGGVAAAAAEAPLSPTPPPPLLVPAASPRGGSGGGAGGGGGSFSRASPRAQLHHPHSEHAERALDVHAHALKPPRASASSLSAAAAAVAMLRVRSSGGGASSGGGGSGGGAAPPPASG